ncbi:hypothetical protein SAMD00019534_098880, partial [Acytostelium subglobosum LB1]|uniref:hypothetical protein n=1 Tax=Acytostelium subglobosum LB1 TaxID=1410327 RepID=UPI0006451E9B
ILDISQSCVVDSYIAPKDYDKEGFVIGIDLGSAYSTMQVYTSQSNLYYLGEPLTIPSYVAFKDNRIIVGNEEAMNQAILDPENTITIEQIRQLIGRRFSDQHVQDSLKSLPFRVVDKDDKPYIVVKFNGEDNAYSPLEIAAMIIILMRKSAESIFGFQVTHAIITCPLNFNDQQREAIKDIGALAGLKVVRVLDEPVSAYLGMDIEKSDGDKNILVFDFGIDMLEVTILNANYNGDIKVLANTNGDTGLSGRIIDQNVAKYFLSSFKNKTKKDAHLDKVSIQKLSRAIDHKRIFGFKLSEVEIKVEDFFEDHDLVDTLTSDKFEDLNKDIFDHLLDPVNRALESSGLNKRDINEYILVGYHCRITKVPKMLSDFFDGKESFNNWHYMASPQRAVSAGAALNGVGFLVEPKLAPYCLYCWYRDYTPTMGIETTGGVMVPFITRNQMVIPARKTHVFTTSRDNQDTMHFKIFEGERPFAKDNNLMNEFEFTGIPLAPRGTPRIEVKFEIDVNGIFQVYAKDLSTGSMKSITINSDSDARSFYDNMEEAMSLKDNDTALVERVQSRISLENFINQIKSIINDKVASKITADNRSSIESSINDVLKWIESNNNYEMLLKTSDDTVSKLPNDFGEPLVLFDEYDTQYKALEKVVRPIITKLLEETSTNLGDNNKQRSFQPHDE